MPLRRLWRLLRLGASADNGYVGSKRRDIGSCSATAGVDNARTRRLRGPGAKPSSPGQQQGQGAVRRQTFSAFLAGWCRVVDLHLPVAIATRIPFAVCPLVQALRLTLPCGYAGRYALGRAQRDTLRFLSLAQSASSAAT